MSPTCLQILFKLTIFEVRHNTNNLCTFPLCIFSYMYIENSKLVNHYFLKLFIKEDLGWVTNSHAKVLPTHAHQHVLGSFWGWTCMSRIVFCEGLNRMLCCVGGRDWVSKIIPESVSFSLNLQPRKFPDMLLINLRFAPVGLCITHSLFCTPYWCNMSILHLFGTMFAKNRPLKWSVCEKVPRFQNNTTTLLSYEIMPHETLF